MALKTASVETGKSAVVIATPWGPCGSSNLFAAQCGYFNQRRMHVALLLSNGGYPVGHKANAFDENKSMDFTADLICRTQLPETSQIADYVNWLRNGRDSSLSILARYFAAAALPAELENFLLLGSCHAIIVNHCFQIGVAEKICDFLAVHGRARPRIVLETHDIQAEQYSHNDYLNPFTQAKDEKHDLIRDELMWCSKADRLSHVTADDLAYFSRRLPVKQQLTSATISPSSEHQFRTAGDGDGGDGFDFVMFAAQNYGNLLSTQWFLQTVVPLVGKGFRIGIVGSIFKRIIKTDPDLYERNRTLFVGEVDDVVPYYRNSRVILLPTRFLTGTSIKTIEALASGKPIVATALAVRSIAPDALATARIEAHDSAEAFAAAMIAALRARQEWAAATQELYREHFSNAAYFAKYDELVFA